MAPKAAQKAAQKKAAKQKKILMLLAIPAVGALIYAYTTFSSLGKSPQPVQATPAGQTIPAGSVPSGAPSTPVTPGISAAPVGSLTSFVALGRKDPFHDHGPKTNGAASSGGSTIHDAVCGAPVPAGAKKLAHWHCGGTGGSTGGSGTGSGGGSTQVPPTGAVIAINGKMLALAVGTKFGHAPGLSGVSLFRLLKVTTRTALVAVVGTKQQFLLHVREPLKLRQDGGWTYTLLLEPLGSAAPMTVQNDTTIHDAGS